MKKSTAEKALSLNLIKPLYGTIAEIGAGQEVARWFFKVGGAAGTIAKAMSAYDMTFSDEIYGKEDCGRYVVESRVRKMLQHEFNLLDTRLSDKERNEKYFFSFADTVAAKSFKYHGDCHGWMGVQFQHHASEEPSKVILHVRMLDHGNIQQQEALGILGVNLLYGAYNYHNNIDAYLGSLLDGELKNRVEINVIHFEGPVFKNVDPIESNLLLLVKGLTPAILIPKDGVPDHPGEQLYDMQVIIHRGLFSPPLLTDFDALTTARNHYCGQKTEGLCDPYLISEMSFRPDKDNFMDLLTRIKQLRSCQQNVMVSNFDRAYNLSEYVAQFTNNHINLVYRANRLIDIMETEEYKSLEPLARIFNENTRVYIYPCASSKIDKKYLKDPQKELFELSDYKPSDKNQHLFEHLVKAGYLQELKGFNKDYAIWDAESFEDCKKKKRPEWKNLIPPEIRS